MNEYIDTDLAVVVVRHDEPVQMLSGCLDNIVKQEGIMLEVHVLDQENDRGVEETVSGFNGINGHSLIYHAVETDSLSLSRNLGVTLSGCRYVAFTDPDCLVSPFWAAGLLHALQRPGVAAAGSRVKLTWMGKETWLHRTLFVKERFAFFDQGSQSLQTDRLVGGSFSIDRDEHSLRKLFDESLGRDKGRLYGGEETDLCKRIISLGGIVLYTPEGTVEHLIPPERMTVPQLLKRAFYSGSSRARRGGAPRPLHSNKTAADHLAIAFFAPIYFMGYLCSRLGLL